MMPRYLKVPVLATTTHCSNDCGFMRGDAKHCRLFDEELTWDAERKFHGNLRLEQCKNLEIKKR